MNKPLDFAIRQPRIPITASGCANPTRNGIIHTDIYQLVDNWRRFYRTDLHYAAVSYYQPPKSGDTLKDIEIATLPVETQAIIHKNKLHQSQQSEITKLPINMQLAIECERAWRDLDNQGIKYYLKWAYIVKMPDAPLWRKMKQYDVRIKNYQDHQLFDRKALEYFQNNLELITTKSGNASRLCGHRRIIR
jgi:hypothetical protein